MAIATQSKEIGGTMFEVTQHPAKRAMRLLTRLGKLAGPLVAMATGPAKGGLAGADAGGLARAIGGLFEALPPDEVDGFLAELFVSTRIIEPDGRLTNLWPVYDLRMQGRTLDALKLAAFVVEVNFSDFFDALRGLQPPGPAAEK